MSTKGRKRKKETRELVRMLLESMRQEIPEELRGLGVGGLKKYLLDFEEEEI